MFKLTNDFESYKRGMFNVCCTNQNTHICIYTIVILNIYMFRLKSTYQLCL